MLDGTRGSSDVIKRYIQMQGAIYNSGGLLFFDKFLVSFIILNSFLSS
jgi:hypothetical protein